MHKESRPRVLILLKHYEPAFRFGGPIRSVVNLVAALHEEFEFNIICLNRDFRETQPLDQIDEGIWLDRSGARVCYLNLGLFGLPKLISAIRSVDYDLVYFNSFFEPLFSTLPALLTKLGLLKRRPIVIAPRGEFSPSALTLKPFKKSLFMRFQSLISLYADASWQATTEIEAVDIKRVLGDKVFVRLAPNLSTRGLLTSQKRAEKVAGRLRIIFLSRIAPTKNLLALLHAAGRLRGSVHLDIWGPIDDAEYWRQCQREMALLQGKIVARYCGESPHESVAGLLGNADLFALPTLGENYGHVIHEALSAGCPVVISDKTPWRNLAGAGVGFDVSLENSEYLFQAIQKFIDMNAIEYNAYTERCRNFAVRHSSSGADIEASRQLFRHAMGLKL